MVLTQLESDFKSPAAPDRSVTNSLPRSPLGLATRGWNSSPTVVMTEIRRWQRRDTAKTAARAVPSQMKLNRVSGSFDEPTERTMGIGERRRVRSALLPFDPSSGPGPRHGNKDGGVFAAVVGVDDDSEWLQVWISSVMMVVALTVEGEGEGRDDDVGRATLGLNEDLEAAVWVCGMVRSRGRGLLRRQIRRRKRRRGRCFVDRRQG